MSEIAQFPLQTRSVPLSADILAAAAMVKLNQAVSSESPAAKHLYRRDAHALLDMAFDLDAIGGTVDAVFRPGSLNQALDNG